MRNSNPEPGGYLPDELTIKILGYIQTWPIRERQSSLAHFAGVNRQWYNIAVGPLYEAPYLVGGAYALFIRTVCPSVLAHIKPTSLSSLVKSLDLSYIVHQGNKSTTARLLARTKESLHTFIAPQASFAINCWASLSKCTRLRILDLSLVSECISFQSLNQTIRQLSALRELHLPRCSSSYGDMAPSMSVPWPPRLQHLSLSGSVSGKFLRDTLRQPENFPPSFYSLSILHSPALDHVGIQSLLRSLASGLTVVELRDLPTVKQGRFNAVLDWLPRLACLTVALDYIDSRFGRMPLSFDARRWREARPLHTLTLLTSGRLGDPSISFAAVDMYALLDERYLGCMRYLNVAASAGWMEENDGAEVGALEVLLCEELDRENWEGKRWHYQDLEVGDMGYDEWKRTGKGLDMRPRLRILQNR